ncbi:MAG: hypothetical protein J7M21_00455 [Planctomycetes bacterium]|nr:hypothetical protein [Planctomycetota bacterium]
MSKTARNHSTAARNHRSKPDGHGGGRTLRRFVPWLLVAAACMVAGGAVVVALRPHDEPAVLAGRPGPSQAERVREAIEELLARAGTIGPAAAPRLRQARRKAYETAVELGRHFVLLSDPKDIRVRPVLAEAQIRLGRLDDAEKTVGALLRLAPRSAEGLLVKGMLLRARGRPDAVDWFIRAARSEQADAGIWSRCGWELLKAGRRDEAEECLARAERAGRADDHTLLGLAMLAMDDGRSEKAEQLLLRLASRSRLNVAGLVMLAEARKNAGKLAEADKTLRRAIAMQDGPALRERLGDVLVLEHRYADAADMYVRAAADPALRGVAAFKAARCYYLLDRYAAAMKYIDLAAACSVGPDVLRWRKKIENAMRGPATAPAGGSLLAIPRPPSSSGGGEDLPAEGTSPAGAAPGVLWPIGPSTAPAGPGEGDR